MPNKYCLPIIKERQQQVFDEINAHLADYTYFEVWLDYITDGDQRFVQQLTEQYPGKIILLFRRQRLEPIHMSRHDRLRLIDTLNKSATFLDLDIMLQKEELDFISDNNLELHVIGSYHDYQNTPSDTELHEIVKELTAYHPEILKVAAYCHDDSDALRLLQLQQLLKERSQKHVVLGMGPHGVITRIFGILWGNEFTFAPNTIQEQSASGQLTKQQLDSIFQILEQAQRI